MIALPSFSAMVQFARKALLWTCLGLVAMICQGLLFFVIRGLMSENQGFDIVLVTIDTQRVDHLGFYNPEVDYTPNLDHLARQGVVFHQAATCIPRTTQGIASLFTGRHPRQHRVRRLFDTLPDSEETLAESLRSQGFHTAAFVNYGPLYLRDNLYQGFVSVDPPAEPPETAERALTTAAKALSWVAGHHHRRYFLWVHLYDDHFFYAPPWPFWDLSDPRNGAVKEYYQKIIDKEIRFGETHFENSLPESTRDRLRELYAGEVAYVDASLGLLFRGIRFLNRLDPGRETLYVVTADHGESLGEHDYYFQHGNYLYDPDVRIPLLFSLPGHLPEGREVQAQVSIVDILPTLQSLVGLEQGEGVAGRDLTPLLLGESDTGVPAFVESDINVFPQNRRFYLTGDDGRWTAVRDGSYKLIHIPHPKGEIVELYDLERDPGETQNLASEQPDIVKKYVQALVDWEAEMKATAAPAVNQAKPDSKKLERLRALGYAD